MTALWVPEPSSQCGFVTWPGGLLGHTKLGKHEGSKCTLQGEGGIGALCFCKGWALEVINCDSAIVPLGP